MTDIAISVENLSKSYLVGHNSASPERYTALRDVVARNVRNLARKTRDMLHGRAIVQGDEVEEFWALKDVSFEIKQGDRVGIIGRNGAGKSTLLKILSRITEPTQGRIEIAGRVASLLEVGTGFHPELSGRENIFLNGAILGMSRREIQQKFDEIVDFAEIERFLDTPVKRYSSGMYMRLAFAVAAHLEPEILIVDEVLAVGDVQFQNKCMGKMASVTNEGRTILFVSHNMVAIKTLCNRAVLLENGAIRYIGTPDESIAKYLAHNKNENSSWKRNASSIMQRDVLFEEIKILDHTYRMDQNLLSGNPFYLFIKISTIKEIKGSQVAVRVINSDGIILFTTANSDENSEFAKLPPGETNYIVKFPKSFLPPGRYEIAIAASVPGIELFDKVENNICFDIHDSGTHATILHDDRIGLITPLLNWKIINHK